MSAVTVASLRRHLIIRHGQLGLDRHEVGYVVGIAKNARLLEQVDIERAVASRVCSHRRWRTRKCEGVSAIHPLCRRHLENASAVRDCQDPSTPTRGPYPRFIVHQPQGTLRNRSMTCTYCARGADGEPHQGAADWGCSPTAPSSATVSWWANQCAGSMLLASLARMWQVDRERDHPARSADACGHRPKGTVNAGSGPQVNDGILA